MLAKDVSSHSFTVDAERVARLARGGKLGLRPFSRGDVVREFGQLAILALLSATALVRLNAAAIAEDMPAAVGRITYGDVFLPGSAICSGTLVAADLVLTAAHCVRGAAPNPASVRFDLAWADGSPAARSVGAEVLLTAGSELSQDAALVVLAEPLPPEVARPLEIGTPDAGLFILRAFRRDAPDRPSPPVACSPLSTQDGLLALDCRATSGNSGAPLLARDGDTWKVIGVMVAASNTGPAHSWAVLPPVWIRETIASRQD